LGNNLLYYSIYSLYSHSYIFECLFHLVHFSACIAIETIEYYFV